MDGAEQKGASVNPKMPDIPTPNADPVTAPKQNLIINGSGVEQVKSEGTAEDTEKDDSGDLGRSQDLDRSKNDIASGAPPAGHFTPGGGGGGGGALGGGGLSGGGGGGSGGGAAEEAASGATPADGGKSADRYTASTSYGTPGGRGGSAEKGIDFGSMLEQFLPKKDDESGSKNGILDFGAGQGAQGGGAGAARNGSLLDKNVNIFKRVHDTYQDKQRAGNVGL